MKSQFLLPDKNISLFVKHILVFEETESSTETVLPFFADGYPGLMFHQTEKGMWVQPQNKKMQDTYLFGQTIHPIEIHISGSYRIIAFQFYPFILNSYFNLKSKDLNNNCYDLSEFAKWKEYADRVMDAKDISTQMRLIQEFLLQLFNDKKEKLDYSIREGMQIILDNKARITVNKICEKLHLTIRTFERRFIKETGVSAKDFIQMTRFQQSLEQLTVKDYNKLSDIVYANGFADQSHFIRVFKAFTGKTPKRFMRKAAD